MVVVEALKARLEQGQGIESLFLQGQQWARGRTWLLMEHNTLIPVEIKASMTFSPDFTKAFPRLRKASARMQAGCVVYAGDLESDFQGNRIINFTNTGTIGA